MAAHGSTIRWWRPVPRPPASSRVSTAAARPPRGPGVIPDHPAAFWCLMFFTFIVLVAPQNAYPALGPLHLAFVSGGAALMLLLIRPASLGQPGRRPTRETRLLLSFTGLALLSIPFSWWRGGSWDMFFGQLLKSLIVYVLVVNLLVAARRFRQHLWLTLLSGIAIALTALLSGATVGGNRLAGAFAGLTANPNDLALTLNLFLPFGLVLFASASIIGRLVAAAFVILSVSAVLLSFSRGGFLTLVTILALFFLRSVRQWGLSALLALAFLGLLGSLLMPAGYGDRVASIVDSEKDESGSSAARLANMARAVRVTMEHPIVGVGLGQSVLALNAKGGWWSVVHNVYLQISTELGIPALVVFLVLLGRLIRHMRTVQSDRPAGTPGRELARFAGATEVSLWAYAVAAMFHPVAYHFYFFYIGGFAAALHAAHQQLNARVGSV